MTGLIEVYFVRSYSPQWTVRKLNSCKDSVALPVTITVYS
jgi:hypothetical protein